MVSIILITFHFYAVLTVYQNEHEKFMGLCRRLGADISKPVCLTFEYQSNLQFAILSSSIMIEKSSRVSQLYQCTEFANSCNSETINTTHISERQSNGKNYASTL